MRHTRIHFPFSRSLTSALLFFIVVLLSTFSFADSRQELEQSLQSRYRVTVIGKGMIGLGSENAIRKAGGTVTLRRPGIGGSFERRETASYAIRGNTSKLLAGRKDIDLQPGQQFYVTSVTVGSDVVEVGLLTVGPLSAAGKNGRVWATAGFFFDPTVIDHGDMATIQAAIDPWLGQGDLAITPTSAPVATAPVRSEVRTATAELKAGMTRDDVVQAAGTPLSEISFGSKSWLTYPGLVAMLDDGKLVNVDRSLQAPSKVSVRSEPAGADILLDGKFVGNTPGNLQLAPGTYAVTLKLQGYAPWQRELSVISGSDAGVQAKLEPSGK